MIDKSEIMHNIKVGSDTDIYLGEFVRFVIGINSGKVDVCIRTNFYVVHDF